LVSRSSRAPRANRQLIRQLIGGRPTAAVNRLVGAVLGTQFGLAIAGAGAKLEDGVGRVEMGSRSAPVRWCGFGHFAMVQLT
jgi:hypothetical protein